MSDPRSLLERESRRFIQQDGAFERLARRRDRKRRNQRIAAGAVGLAVGLAAILIGSSLRSDSTGPIRSRAACPIAPMENGPITFFGLTSGLRIAHAPRAEHEPRRLRRSLHGDVERRLVARRRSGGVLRQLRRRLRERRRPLSRHPRVRSRDRKGPAVDRRRVLRPVPRLVSGRHENLLCRRRAHPHHGCRRLERDTAPTTDMTRRLRGLRTGRTSSTRVAVRSS